MAMEKLMAKPGHLATGELRLVQTEQTKEAIRKAATAQHALSRMRPVVLDWQAPSKKDSVCDAQTADTSTP